MADKPILFSAPMVRALLTGEKTQTRRILKPQPDYQKVNVLFPKGGLMAIMFDSCGDEGLTRALKKVYRPGDRLWCRESWRSGWENDGFDEFFGREKTPSEFDPDISPIEYLADEENELSGRNWPSIFMPRWASRLTLIVTDVRIQRLQDINRGDCMEEGCPFPNIAKGDSPRDWYAGLWNAINGPGAWDANPFVAAYTFTVHKCNIDEMERASITGK